MDPNKFCFNLNIEQAKLNCIQHMGTRMQNQISNLRNDQNKYYVNIYNTFFLSAASWFRSQQ